MGAVQSPGHYTTSTGLRINAKLDSAVYEKGLKVSDDEIDSLSRRRHEFHGDWNYTFKPQ